MVEKLMSMSDELMWKYYLLLTDLTPGEIEAEKQKGAPMASKMTLARRIAADFHGGAAARAAEAEWRRVHQERQVPSEMPLVELEDAVFKPHQLLVRLGLETSSSGAARLLRQNAVKLDGSVVAPTDEVRLDLGREHVLSVGPKRFVRLRRKPPA
jgi:tyrosyl-tRNA synthetase